MKIRGMHRPSLRNDEHFQFLTDFGELVNKIGADALHIETQFNACMVLFEDEDAALNKIMKSAITPEIREADRRRDNIFSGMVNVYKGALKHFDAEKAAAARELKPVFDTYGNLAAKPFNEQSAAVINLLQELTGKYAGYCQTIGITEWVSALADANNAVIALMHDRYDEGAERCDIVLRTARLKVDDAYRAVVERVNALVVVEGTERYEEFITTLNLIVEKYANIIAQRAGKSKKAKERKSAAAVSEDQA